MSKIQSKNLRKKCIKTIIIKYKKRINLDFDITFYIQSISTYIIILMDFLILSHI